MQTMGTADIPSPRTSFVRVGIQGVFVRCCYGSGVVMVMVVVMLAVLAVVTVGCDGSGGGG